MKLAPSILSGDFAYFGEAVKLAEKGGADYIHIDVMDGHFVPNITIGPQTVSALKKYTSLPMDVHLMITNPDSYVDRFAEAGADIITVHAEAPIHLHRTLQSIKQHNILAGVSLNPATPLSVLDHIMPDIDLLLLMTVNPGFGGQVYIPQMTEKIHQARKRIDSSGYSILLEVDGGVNESNISRLAQYGVDICVAGSAVYNSDDVVANVKKLKKLSN
ncbi:MAG: ribulose-phosphate 3-epimerase [Candidatus Auribacter fodinae]|jgi:ribulose-phosphate 3-epimerase|uniref:Ribulose-phosphate 3-epimerase n=1 Tax=Candidatus Auribacter fodinae TaxID=2093366 RepID=A0A3A4R6W2_9BACT|nr:MAG: ribulose-phosphate 3-epimerase [Candidatus Auribacter fodinae]